MRGNNRLLNFSKKLRRNMTDAERHLWRYLRNRQLEGYKFRRQQVIENYIVDFVNFEKKNNNRSGWRTTQYLQSERYREGQKIKRTWI
jgi:hypothetical protein